MTVLRRKTNANHLHRQKKMLCEVVTYDDSNFACQCDDAVEAVRSNNKGDFVLLCGYHHFYDADKLPELATDEITIARKIAERQREDEWKWRTMWHNSKSDPEMWDIIHKPTNRNPIISASNAASALGFGYIARSTMFRSFFKGWKEPSDFMKAMYLTPGSENEPEALRTLITQLWMGPRVIGIDVEQRTWRGWFGDAFLAATPDAVFRTIDGDYAVEIKCPQRPVPAEPEPRHVLQILLQMHLFRYKADPAKRLTKGYLFYWKSTTDTACFVVRYNAQVMTTVVDALRQFVECVEKETKLEKIDTDYFIKLVMTCV